VVADLDLGPSRFGVKWHQRNGLAPTERSAAASSCSISHDSDGSNFRLQEQQFFDCADRSRKFFGCYGSIALLYFATNITWLHPAPERLWSAVNAVNNYTAHPPASELRETTFSGRTPRDCTYPISNGCTLLSRNFLILRPFLCSVSQ
jgi:hypothetical protein